MPIPSWQLGTVGDDFLLPLTASDPLLWIRS
jgi:hypothetical protein